MRLIYAFFILAFVSSATDPAIARPHKDKGKQHEAEGIVEALISLADRTILRGYLHDNYRPHCPPGLAKKRNGCLPPGIAKKYAMGKALPPGIAAKRLPDGLLSQLHPLAGYQYVQVDQDVLLISEATKKVVDAVTLLSAVK
jgi:hypothetical protein